MRVVAFRPGEPCDAAVHDARYASAHGHTLLTDRVSFLGWTPSEALPAHERFELASCLVHMVDDATDRAGGRFEPQETI